MAGQLLVTAGDNPHRLRSQAAFAMLCGAAPLPASSGRTQRHRLNRGGDRQANCALYQIVLCRLRWDPGTRAYAQRRTAEGMGKKEIIRCLKRYIAREAYAALLNPAPSSVPATSCAAQEESTCSARSAARSERASSPQVPLPRNEFTGARVDSGSPTRSRSLVVPVGRRRNANAATPRRRGPASRERCRASLEV